MSKRRHKRREDNIIENGYNGINNNPFGINPMQLMSMMGNIDVSEINKLMTSMNSEGFDFNNLNLNTMKNFMGGNAGSGNINGSNNNINTLNNNINDVEENIEDNKDINIDLSAEINNPDENIQMLIALKSIVDSSKVRFIDRIIELYKEGAFND